VDQPSDLDVLFMAGETASQHLHVPATLILDHSEVNSDSSPTVFHRALEIVERGLRAGEASVPDVRPALARQLVAEG